MTPRRIKVVHIHKISGVSGSEKHLLQLLPSFDRNIFDPICLVLAKGESDREFSGELARRGVRVARLRIRAHFDPLLLARMAAWLRRESPDIVHTHLIHADLHGVCAARLAGIPIVVSTKHNDDRFRHYAVIGALERWLARRVSKTITISEALRQFVIEAVGLEPAEVVTVRYGYDPHADELRSHASATDALRMPAHPSILAVGRLVAQKGHDVLVRAFVEVRKAVPDARLTIVGEGPLRKPLSALIARSGLQDCVTLAGQRDDVSRLMEETTVVAHPSRWEGFGLVLLEAMAARRPIVASGVSAIPEIVADGETGTLVPPDDPAALAAALTTLLAAPEAAASMGAAGRRRLDTEFSLRAMVQRTEQLYRTVLENRTVDTTSHSWRRTGAAPR